MTGTADEQLHRRDSRRRDVVITIALFGLLFAFLITPVLAMPFQHEPDGAPTTVNAAAAMPAHFTLDGQPQPVTAIYEYAKEHASLLVQLPCYCGCKNFLAHKDLEQCFVSRDGSWDSHASGCLVCQNEATRARTLAEKGQSGADIRAALIREYGPRPTA